MNTKNNDQSETPVWPLVRLGDCVTARSGNSQLIKGRLPQSPGPKLFPAFSASGQDIYCESFEHDGDGIVLSAVGARCGKSFRASGRWVAIANTHVIKVRQEVADTDFIWFRTNDEKFWLRGGTAQPFVKVRESLEQKIPLPPLEEQRQIAAVLGKLQATVEVEGELVRVTRELKQAALRQLFTRGLHGEPQKQTDLGPLPESWDIKSVGELCTLSSGGTPDRSNPTFWKNGTIPWVKTGEIDYRVVENTEERITQLGLDNSAAKLLPAGTLIMAMYGQGITRGRVARLGIDATTNQACAAIVPRKDSVVTSDYLYHFFVSAYERLRALGHGANQKNLNLEIIRQVTVPLPKDKSEQREIAAHLAAIDAKLAHHEARRALLRELFRTLLRDLMTARRRVNDLDLTALSS